MTATKTWREAVAALEAARERASEVLGHPLISDLVDRRHGELHPILVVTDNGPCYKAGASRATSTPGPSSSTSALATVRRKPTA